MNKLVFFLILSFVGGCASPPTKMVPLDQNNGTPKSNESAKITPDEKVDKKLILEKRKAEVLKVNAESQRHALAPLCGEGGKWGYFTQNPKHQVDGWDISRVKGNFKTFAECEAARKKLKNAYFTERCDAKKNPPKRTYEVTRATFHDYGGNRHVLYFSKMEMCKKALSEGLYWYHVIGYQNGEEEAIDFVEPQGKGYDSFDSECEVEELDACNEGDGRINLQL